MIFNLMRPDNVTKTSNIEFSAIFDLVRLDNVAKTCQNVANTTEDVVKSCPDVDNVAKTCQNVDNMANTGGLCQISPFKLPHLF